MEHLNRIVHSTLSYAKSRKDEKKNRYALFMRKPFTKEEVRVFWGCLILLGYTMYAIIERHGVSQEHNIPCSFARTNDLPNKI